MGLHLQAVSLVDLQENGALENRPSHACSANLPFLLPQHNLYNQASDSNPWGNFQAGPGLGRALQRLGDRHGISEWH